MPNNSTGPQGPQNDASGKNSPSSSSSSSNGERTPIPDGLRTLLFSNNTRVGEPPVIMAHMHAMLQALTSRNIGNLSQRLLELIRAMVRGEVYRRIFAAFGSYIVAHPWQVAGFVIGIVLIANPLALAGFGALGPVVGSLAAAWQASIGSVAAGSLFAFLQSAGMLYAVAIPLTGALMVGAAAGTAVLTASPGVTGIRGKYQQAREWMNGKVKKT
ncbi:hypothetical protein BDZ89DRAFT_1121141 [Hymenopellis radicata]|nr:hypothetical protein BDZ89DRAFT_1121141 [Hymenopellis radicata]